MKSVPNKIQNINTFLLLSVCLIIASYLSKLILNMDELMVNSFADYYTYSQINEIMNQYNKYVWLGYLVIPVILFIKVVVIAFIIDIGVFFFGKEISFKRLFNIVTKAEFIFIVPIIIKTAWFYAIAPVYDLQDAQQFYPLSAMQLFDADSLQTWFTYPLQMLNVFEIVYWIFLSVLLAKTLKLRFNKSLQIIACSYGTALVIWTVGIMFITLNAS